MWKNTNNCGIAYNSNLITKVEVEIRHMGVLSADMVKDLIEKKFEVVSAKVVGSGREGGDSRPR